MDEWSEQPGSSEPLQVRARLAESPPDALRRADPEPSADQAVQGDVTRDDVSARLGPGEVDLIQDLGFDKGQLVPAAGTAERPSPGRVAVAFQAASRRGGDILDGDERRFRLRRDQDRCN